jgi:hypothetical protein
MFTFSSNDQFLRRLAQRLREAPDRIHRDMERRVRETAEELLEEQFASGRNPYGQPYPPPKDGHLPPMVRTGRLRRGLRVVVSSSADGISLSVQSEAPYAQYLQSGTRRMAPRRIVPGTTVLAERWRQRLQAACTESVRAWMEGRI